MMHNKCLFAKENKLASRARTVPCGKYAPSLCSLDGKFFRACVFHAALVAVHKYAKMLAPQILSDEEIETLVSHGQLDRELIHPAAVYFFKGGILRAAYE